MTERPILFSAPMVRAILDGTKTQTRRIVKPQPSLSVGWDGYEFSVGGRDYVCPYGAPGDRLWVRETWAGRMDPSTKDEVIYRANGEPFTAYPKWRPSIHMPRWASRITLAVESVRVERLQAITEEDARAEGAGMRTVGDSPHALDKWAHWTKRLDQGATVATHRGAFAMLWSDINGAESWAANPWVWVIGFRRAERAERGTP